MNKVLQFLISRINFIVFFLLEICCFVLIYLNNPYQNAALFNSCNAFTAGIMNDLSYVKGYLLLQETNNKLLSENALLKSKLLRGAISQDISFRPGLDSIYLTRYDFIAAKVINNSTANFRNYLTINKGLTDSLAPGMAVISSEGIVGKVKSCSKNFSTITSVLHKDGMVSAKVKRTNTNGSLRWDGINAKEARLLYIPRHTSIKKGDTITTSEFNSVFPEGEMIGKVRDIKIHGDESFYTIFVDLSTDFNSLTHVYVIRNKLNFQQDSLERANISDRNEAK